MNKISSTTPNQNIIFVKRTIKGTVDDNPLKRSMTMHPSQFFKSFNERVSKLTTHKQKKVFEELNNFIDNSNKKDKGFYYANDFSRLEKYQMHDSVGNTKALKHYVNEFKKLAGKNGFNFEKLIKL